MSDSIFLTDGNGVLTGLVAGSDYSGDIIIPEYVNGERITSIGEEAFSNYTGITSITIPDSVISIGGWAFSFCTSLTSIIIPNSVTSIGSGVFSRTPWLINKQDENPLVIINGILVDGYACSGEVIIPNGVTTINGYAFNGDEDITSIIIPNSVIDIGEHAFDSCINLTSITIPNSVTSINRFAFWGTYRLTEIYVIDPNNLSNAVGSYDWSITGSTNITFVKYVDRNLDYLIKNGTLIDIADKIRILSGEEETLSPAEMGTELDEANQEVSVQSDLIDQLIDALDGKVGTGMTETWTFTMEDGSIVTKAVVIV